MVDKSTRKEPDPNPVGLSTTDLPADTLSIPRWIVYFQAAMLGLVATTFFIFGILVGSLGNGGHSDLAIEETIINGTVLTVHRGQQVPDAGAVVFLLPSPPTAIERQDPETVRPSHFEPLENPTIDWIRSQGGSVIRANIDGKFELIAKPGQYHLLVISKAKSAGTDQKLSREQVAALSQYFLPVDQLIEKQEFHWRTLKLAQESFELGDIVFK